MHQTFFKGVAQGMGIIAGILVFILLMQLSAHFLQKFGIMENPQIRLEQEYNDGFKVDKIRSK